MTLLIIHLITFFGFVLITISTLGFIETLIHNIHGDDKESDRERLFMTSLYVLGIILLFISLVLYHTLII